MLNRILETELAGVRTEFVRFTVAIFDEGTNTSNPFDLLARVGFMPSKR